MNERLPLTTVGDSGQYHSPSPLASRESWSLKVWLDKTLVKEYSLDELLQLEQGYQESMEIECVSSGKIIQPRDRLRVAFGGVRFATLFRDLGLGDKLSSVDELSPIVTFTSRAPGTCGPRNDPHWTALPLRDCLDPAYQIMLATSIDGQELPYGNGGPLRSVVGPRLYFYKAVKWLSEITFLKDSIDNYRGTWEDHAGYHNRARTNLKERFEPRMRIIREVRMDESGQLYDVSEVVPEKDWQKTLEGMLADPERGLSRLIAARLHEMGLKLPKVYRNIRFVDGNFKAKIRGTRFSSCEFHGVDLRGVNFSLSYLTAAKFLPEGGIQTQLDGCDFEGAHLQNAWLQDVSMQGAWLTNTEFTQDFSPSPRVKDLDVSGAHNLSKENKEWLAKNGAKVE